MFSFPCHSHNVWKMLQLDPCCIQNILTLIARKKNVQNISCLLKIIFPSLSRMSETWAQHKAEVKIFTYLTFHTTFNLTLIIV